MFSLKMERSRSDSSASSLSSALSLSSSGWTPRATLSPATTTTTPLGGSPDLLALKPIISKPSILRPKRALTAPTSVPHYETFCPSSGRGAFGYPCWPAGESLSAGSSPANSKISRTDNTVPPSPSLASAQSYQDFQPPTSRISDDDLESLDFSAMRSTFSDSQALEAVCEVPVGAPEFVGGISWSQVGGANAEPAQAAEPPRRRRLPPPPPGMAMGDTRRRKRVPSRSSSRGGACRRRMASPC